MIHESIPCTCLNGIQYRATLVNLSDRADNETQRKMIKATWTRLGGDPQQVSSPSLSLVGAAPGMAQERNPVLLRR